MPENDFSKEQLRALIKSQTMFAQVISNYFLELKRTGFTEEQALALTISYQESIINPKRNYE